jgi:hypothetical protein
MRLIFFKKFLEKSFDSIFNSFTCPEIDFCFSPEKGIAQFKMIEQRPL